MNKIITKLTAVMSAYLLATSTFGSITANASTTPTLWYQNHGYTDSKLTSASLYVSNASNRNATLDVYGVESNGNYKTVSDCSGYSHIETIGVIVPAYNKRTVRQYVKELGCNTVYVYFYGEASGGQWCGDASTWYSPVN